MLADLLPTTVACAESFGADDPGVTTPFPAEAAAVAPSVAGRRTEFFAVRACARQALATLGIAPVAILPGEQREPQWPTGVVGSMTHCAGYRAAAVARAGDVLTLGIDAEEHAPLPADVLAMVSLPDERASLRALARSHPGVAWDRLLFSVKESVFKAWFPLTGRWLGFEQAAVRLDASGGWSASLLVDGPVVGDRELTRFDGRWAASAALVVTAVSLAAGPGERPGA